MRSPKKPLVDGGGLSVAPDQLRATDYRLLAGAHHATAAAIAATPAATQKGGTKLPIDARSPNPGGPTIRAAAPTPCSNPRARPWRSGGVWREMYPAIPGPTSPHPSPVTISASTTLAAPIAGESAIPLAPVRVP